MLSPSYFKGADKPLQTYFQNLEEEVLRDVAKNLYSATSKNKIEALIDLDYSYKNMEKKIAKYSNESVNRIGNIMTESGIKSYADDKARYERVNKHLPDFKKNLSAMKFVEIVKKTSQDDLTNITRTTGVAGKGLDSFYKTELSQAIVNLRSGAYSSEQVMRKVVDMCAGKGLQTINYNSGRSLSIESAVRICVNTGMRQISNEMGLMNAKMMDQDLMELSAHSGARPSHADWQGQIVSLSGRPGYLSLTDIGYGDTTGFGGINCRHSWYPFFEGLSDPAYSDFEEAPPFEYEGKEYTEYEASQRMRRLENSMRKEKRKILMYDELEEVDLYTIHSVRLQRLRQEYKRFTKAANLKPQIYRGRISGYNKSKNSKQVWRNHKVEIKANSLYDLGTTEKNVNANLRDKPLQEYIKNNDDFKVVKNGKQLNHLNDLSNIKNKSQFKNTLEEITSILLDRVGTGEIFNKNKSSLKELIHDDRLNGYVFDEATDTIIFTTKAIIHYSKDGIHLVPALRKFKELKDETI